MPENMNDPAATFHLDQQEAAEEQATRDQVVWAQNVANAQANTAHTEAQAELLRAQANALSCAVVCAPPTLAFLAVRSLLRSLRRTR